MPHVSKRRLKKKTYQQINRRLIETFENAYDNKSFMKIFHELFTYTEKVMLAKRLAIIFLLSQEIPQHRIVDMLHVSPSTVARMSLCLETGKYDSIVKITAKKKGELVKFVEFLLSAGETMPPIAGRGRWKKVFKEF